MNTQDIRQQELETEIGVVETVETPDATLHIQTGVKAGFWSDKEIFDAVQKVKGWF